MYFITFKADLLTDIGEVNGIVLGEFAPIGAVAKNREQLPQKIHLGSCDCCNTQVLHVINHTQSGHIIRMNVYFRVLICTKHCYCWHDL